VKNRILSTVFLFKKKIVEVHSNIWKIRRGTQSPCVSPHPIQPPYISDARRHRTNVFRKHITVVVVVRWIVWTVDKNDNVLEGRRKIYGLVSRNLLNVNGWKYVYVPRKQHRSVSSLAFYGTRRLEIAVPRGHVNANNNNNNNKLNGNLLRTSVKLRRPDLETHLVRCPSHSSAVRQNGRTDHIPYCTDYRVSVRVCTSYYKIQTQNKK